MAIAVKGYLVQALLCYLDGKAAEGDVVAQELYDNLLYEVVEDTQNEIVQESADTKKPTAWITEG